MDQRSALLSRIAEAVGVSVEQLALSGNCQLMARDCHEMVSLLMAIKDPKERQKLIAMARGMVQQGADRLARARSGL